MDRSGATNFLASRLLLLMSIIYNVNNNGPRAEPCGIPQLIFLQVNCLLSKVAYDLYAQILDTIFLVRKSFQTM